MGSKFSERETEVAGVVELSSPNGGRGSASYDGAAFFRSGLRWAAPMIRVNGRLALAECVMKNIKGGAGYMCRWDGVKFGPGGRRRYCWVTEELIEEILKACAWGGANWRKNVREEERNAQIAEFAMDLLDELS